MNISEMSAGVARGLLAARLRRRAGADSSLLVTGWHLAAIGLALVAALAALGNSAEAQTSLTTRPPLGDKEWPVVKEGTTRKISQHVYVIPSDSVPRVPNVGIIVGTKATMIIDPGMGLLSGEAVAREMAKVSKNTELYVVSTHLHPEHTTGEQAFPNAKIIRAKAQHQDIEGAGMRWVEMFAKRSPELAEILRGATFRKPDETFDKEKTVDLGGVRVRLMWVGPAHTLGDTAFFVEGDNVLFAGDLAMKNIFPAFAMPQSSMRAWLARLDELERLGATQVVGAHGDLTDASIIKAYRELLAAIQARAGQLKAEGKSAEEAGKQLAEEFKAKYKDWDQPIRVIPAVAVVYKEVP
jgi:glyoxylase-like metal-dependent hydrolase (beta-lactamase superfamily II)